VATWLGEQCHAEAAPELAIGILDRHSPPLEKLASLQDPVEQKSER
jgi:hypothetical protein